MIGNLFGIVSQTGLVAVAVWRGAFSSVVWCLVDCLVQRDMCGVVPGVLSSAAAHVAPCLGVVSRDCHGPTEEIGGRRHLREPIPRPSLWWFPPVQTMYS